MGLPVWMGSVPEYEVINNNMHISVGDFVLACPVHVFLQGCAKGRSAIGRWERERTSAEVVAFPLPDIQATG
jgi:hypothetical protein